LTAILSNSSLLLTIFLMEKSSLSNFCIEPVKTITRLRSSIINVIIYPILWHF